MTFRVRYRLQGRHAHCTLYVAVAPDRTFVLLGNFVMREDELEELRQQCPKIQFLPVFRAEAKTG